MAALVFLIALPLTVFTLAGCLQVIDQTSSAGRFAALLKVSFRLLLFALLALLTPPESRPWLLYGVLASLVLTFTASAVSRYAIRSGRWPTERID